jgi:hypothetical protein
VARRRHNTQTARDRQRLLSDFEQRLEYDRQTGDRRHWLVRPQSIAWVVHLTADETELLAELGVHPSECRSVDAYWRYAQSLYWVEVRATGDHASPARIDYRFDRQYRWDQFLVWLPTQVVTTRHLHRIFERLERVIDSGRVEGVRSGLADEEGRWLTAGEPLETLALEAGVS